MKRGEEEEEGKVSKWGMRGGREAKVQKMCAPTLCQNTPDSAIYIYIYTNQVYCAVVLYGGGLWSIVSLKVFAEP